MSVNMNVLTTRRASSARRGGSFQAQHLADLFDHDRQRWAGERRLAQDLLVDAVDVDHVRLGEVAAQPVEDGRRDRDAVARADAYRPVDAHSERHSCVLHYAARKAKAVASARDDVPIRAYSALSDASTTGSSMCRALAAISLLDRALGQQPQQLGFVVAHRAFCRFADERRRSRHLDTARPARRSSLPMRTAEPAHADLVVHDALHASAWIDAQLAANASFSSRRRCARQDRPRGGQQDLEVRIVALAACSARRARCARQARARRSCRLGRAPPRLGGIRLGRPQRMAGARRPVGASPGPPTLRSSSSVIVVRVRAHRAASSAQATRAPRIGPPGGAAPLPSVRPRAKPARMPLGVARAGREQCPDRGHLARTVGRRRSRGALRCTDPATAPPRSTSPSSRWAWASADRRQELERPSPRIGALGTPSSPRSRARSGITLARAKTCTP